MTAPVVSGLTLIAIPKSLAHLSNLPPVLLLLISPLVYTIYLFARLYSSPLRHIPGPFLARFTSLPLARQVFLGQTSTHVDDLHARYGPLVQIAPNCLLLGDFSELARIQGVRSRYTRGDWNLSVRVDREQCQESVVTTLDPKEYASRKEKLKGGFSRAGRGWDKVVDEQIGTLVMLLRKYADSNQAFDFANVVRFFVSDVTTAAVMGRPLGWLKGEKDAFAVFEGGNRLIGRIFGAAFLPPLRRIVTSWWWMKRFGPFSPEKKHGTGRWWGVVREELDRRSRSPEQKHEDMLTEWLAQGMTPHECELDAVLALVAGADTTSSSVRAILLYLISSPPGLNRLKAEISQATMSGTISNPVTYNEARQLPYLQAVLYEGIRMMPSIVLGFPKCVPAAGDTICGIRVPEGTEVFQNYRAVMRDQAVFGEDVSIFRPERWIECSEEKKAQMTRHVESVFGFGRWQCLGRTLAWTEMNKVVVELVRNFDFQIVNPTSPWTARTYSTVSIEDFSIRVVDARTEGA
ncbi:putative cytochrome P450 E-class, group I [Naviculisporaceae sp. PSN 640]